jgi:hypothetical protein
MLLFSAHIVRPLAETPWNNSVRVGPYTTQNKTRYQEL